LRLWDWIGSLRLKKKKKGKPKREQLGKPLNISKLHERKEAVATE
jgi:hypothetical protein